jgi:hypothetical protein
MNGYGDYLLGDDYRKIAESKGDKWAETREGELSVASMDTPVYVSLSSNYKAGKTEIFLGINDLYFGGGYMYLLAFPAKDGKVIGDLDDARLFTEAEMTKLENAAKNEAEKKCGAPVFTEDTGKYTDSIYISGDVVIVVLRDKYTITYAELSIKMLADGYGISTELAIERLTD